MRCGGQDDVVRLDADEFVEHGARGVAEARALLPHLETLPQHEGEEADQDVGLHAIGALMPDWPHAQLILVNAEVGLGLGELDVGSPQLLVAPVLDVGAQHVGAFGDSGPLVEGFAALGVQAQAGRTVGDLQGDVEAGGRALVALEEAADLAVDRVGIEPLARALDAPGELD